MRLDHLLSMEQVKGKTFVEVPKRNLKGKRESLLFIFEGAAFKRRRNWEREDKTDRKTS